MNLEGLSERFSVNPINGVKVRYFENNLGVLVAKDCTSCKETKDLESYTKLKNGRGGRAARCKMCDKKYYKENKKRKLETTRLWYEANKERKREKGSIWERSNPEKVALINQRRRTRKKSLTDDFTAEQMTEVMDFFGGCALTGETENVHWDHVIPLLVGYGGTTYGNMIPLRADLNNSKFNHNIFDWFKTNRQRFEISQERFDILIDHLASANAMTVEEYRDYVYRCHANPRNIDELEAQ